ncbi:MAG: hypothetical protein AAGC43_08980 [Bacteroidota bacterium]
MTASQKTLPKRIVIFSLLVSLVFVGYALCNCYADEISQKVTNAIAEAIPDLDTAVAKL